MPLVFAAGVDRDREMLQIPLDSLSIGQLLKCCNPKVLLLEGHLDIHAFTSALEKCLARFQLLSGRLHAPSPQIARRNLQPDRPRSSYISICNSGAQLDVEDNSTLSIDQISLHRSRFSHDIDLGHLPSYCSPLRDPTSGKEPVMKIKITPLSQDHSGSRRATILSFNWLHALVDGSSASIFISSLASFYCKEVGECQESENTLPPEVTFDRSELFSQPPQLSLEVNARAKKVFMPPVHQDPISHKEPPTISSLELQRIPKPGWGKAFRSILSLVKMAIVEESRFVSFRSDLSSITLHLPASTVKSLKAIASNDGSQISTNDAVSSLIWILVNSLRNRPLPGSKGSTETMQGSLGLAIDMRKNCGISQGLFGNAVWALHVKSISDDPITVSASASSYARALICGAHLVRRALIELRTSKINPGAMISNLSDAMCSAPTSSQWHMAANIMRGQDAMVSSWMFDYYSARFGSCETRRVMGYVLPTPSWSCAVLPSKSGPGAGHGGLDLILTVPSSSILALRSSSLLNELTPDARFHY